MFFTQVFTDVFSFSAAGDGNDRADLRRLLSTCTCVCFNSRSESRGVDGGVRDEMCSRRRGGEAVRRVRYSRSDHQTRHIGDCHRVPWRETETVVRIKSLSRVNGLFE